MKEDKYKQALNLFAYLMETQAETNAKVEVLYEKLRENNIDMSDFQKRYESTKLKEMNRLQNDMQDFERNR